MFYKCGEIIKDLCRKKGIQVKTLENDLNFSNGYISMMAKQGTRPKEERLKAIADYLGVSPEFILGEGEQPTSTGGVMIPLLGRVAAGVPITAIENVIGQEEITQKKAASGEFFALKIKGDSMSPFIMDGDVVVVRQQEDAETDEIVIAIVNGNDGVCKKLKKTDDAIVLVSINPEYDPMVFPLNQASSVRIVGKVDEIRRKV